MMRSNFATAHLLGNWADYSKSKAQCNRVPNVIIAKFIIIYGI
jgi:hypothetical protein